MDCTETAEAKRGAEIGNGAETFCTCWSTGDISEMLRVLIVTYRSDRTTNYHSLWLLFRVVPEMMYDMMGYYFDTGNRIHNTINNKVQISLTQIADAATQNEFQFYQKTHEGVYDSPTWCALMRFITDPKIVFE